MLVDTFPANEAAVLGALMREASGASHSGQRWSICAI